MTQPPARHVHDTDEPVWLYAAGLFGECTHTHTHTRRLKMQACFSKLMASEGCGCLCPDRLVSL